MKNTSDHHVGPHSEQRPLHEIIFGAERATVLRTSKFTIAAIRERLARRVLTISRHSVVVLGDATKPSLVFSASDDTGAGNTKQKEPSGSRPDGLSPPAGYKRLRFRLRSVSPLIMHNGQLANPLNTFAKAMKKVSGKRAKTEADFEELARLEFLGGLYVNADRAPCIPGELLEAVLIEGAKKMRRGQQAKAGIICDGNFALEYEGPRTPDDLWKDESFRLQVGVRIQRNRIIRTRAIFRKWEANVTVDYMPGELNESDVTEMVATAGMRIGLCDWRPKFGRFAAEAL